jgi:invasion protein IalB
VEVSDPLVKAMKTGSTATVTLRKTKVPAYTVPLTGSARALEKLVRACK